jgi:hypothetical protein
MENNSQLYLGVFWIMDHLLYYTLAPASLRGARSCSTYKMTTNFFDLNLSIKPFFKYCSHLSFCLRPEVFNCESMDPKFVIINTPLGRDLRTASGSAI